MRPFAMIDSEDVHELRSMVMRRDEKFNLILELNRPETYSCVSSL